MNTAEARTPPGTLRALLDWGERAGDVSVMKRLRMKLLPLTVRERIVLHKVEASTQCSVAYFEAARQALEEILREEYRP